MLEIVNVGNNSKIRGEVDLATAEEFENAIMELVNTKEPRLELDLSGLDYIDSTGVGILMNVKKNLLEEGQDLVIINPTPNTLKLFKLTGIDRVFTIEEQ